MQRPKKSDQVVESDALLSAAHVLKEAVIGHQQQLAGVLLVVVDVAFSPVVVVWKTETSHQSIRGTKRKSRWTHWRVDTTSSRPATDGFI